MSNYSVKTIARTAVPRSKRLREGAAPEGGTTGSWSLTGGHTHSNKDALDLFRYDPARNVIYVGDEDNPINLAAYGQVSGGGINGETPTPVTTTLGGLMNVTNEADNVQTVDKILVRRANASGNNSWTLANLSDISGTVVGIRMNGTVKSPGTDKIVDLGTIITSLAGYATETYVSNNFLASSLKGAANGLAELGSDGKVPSSQLPSYVDDVLEYSSTSAFPATGESGKIYVALDTNKTYRWGGSEYVEISASLALGETSSTAYRGDRGKIAYDHSQISGGSTVHHTHSNKAALDLLRYDAQKNLLYIGDENNRINFAAYGAVSAGGVSSGGGDGVRHLYQLEDVPDYRTSYRGKYLRAKSDGSGTEWADVQGGASTFAQLAGSPYDNTRLATALNGKQDALTAGANIAISNGTISAADTHDTNTSGTGIAVSGTRGSTIAINSTYQAYINNGNTAYGWGNHADAGYQPASTAITTSNIGSQSVANAGYSNTVYGSYTSSGGQQNPTYFGRNRVGFLMMNTTVNGNSQYKDWLIMDCYSGSDVGGGVAFGVNRQSLGAYIMRSEAARTSWSQSAELYGTHNANKSTVAWACSSLSASGNIVGSGQVAAGSDIRWKVNIAPVRPNVIDCLNPVEWDWKDGHGKGHSAGLVAQQVARILPFAVMGNEADGYVLNYNVFHAYEIAELQSLRRRVAELERKLNIF